MREIKSTMRKKWTATGKREHSQEEKVVSTKRHFFVSHEQNHGGVQFR